MNVYYFEAEDLSEISCGKIKKVKGYVRASSELYARSFLHLKRHYIISKLELDNEYEMRTDFETYVEPTKAQKFANLVSKFIIKIKDYCKAVKEEW